MPTLPRLSRRLGLAALLATGLALLAAAPQASAAEAQPPAAAAPVKPAEPTRVLVSSLNPERYHFVQVGRGLPCLTPCQVEAPAGPTPIVISDNKGRYFSRSLELSPGLARLQVATFSPAHAITAASLGGFGILLLLIGGSYVTANPALAAGLLTVGGVADLSGIIAVATVPWNSLRLRTLPKETLRAAVAPARQGTGGVVTIGGRF